MALINKVGVISSGKMPKMVLSLFVIFLIGCSENLSTFDDSETPELYIGEKNTTTEMSRVLNSGLISPSHTIISPATNRLVSVGTGLEFIGQVNADVIEFPNLIEPLSYLWIFDNAVPNSTSLSPGLILFDKPGKYNIQFYVINALGEIVGDSVKRKVEVSNSIIARIVSPSKKRINIQLGESVDFAADFSVPDSAVGQTVNFLWMFQGATPDASGIPRSSSQNPGVISFNTAGKIDISFSVLLSDANGVVTDFNSTKISLNVIDPLAIPITPPGKGPKKNNGIVNPPADIAILLDSALTFEGLGFDTAVSGSENYRWQFNVKKTPPGPPSGPPPGPPLGPPNPPPPGLLLVMPDILVQSPGDIIFDQAGEYKIRYDATAIDITGAALKIKGDRKIRVIDPLVPAKGPNKINGILSPQFDMVVAVGTSLILEGLGLNTAIAGSESYLWKFKAKKAPPTPSPPASPPGPGPRIPDILTQTSEFTFDLPGEYNITYDAAGIDVAGKKIKIKGKRKVIVLAL